MLPGEPLIDDIHIVTVMELQPLLYVQPEEVVIHVIEQPVTIELKIKN